MTKNKKKYWFAEIIRHVVLAWFVGTGTEILLLPGKIRDLSGMASLKNMSFIRVAAVTLCGTLLLTFLGFVRRIRKVERWAIVFLFAGMAAAAIVSSFTWPFFTICMILFMGLLHFGISGWDGSEEPEWADGRTRKRFRWLTVILAILFFLFVSIWTVCRVGTFSTPSYDFGIFSQMFYHMKESGLPMTTLERDGLLSHFCVHMSPIYYLMLPLYMLIPHPATLQVLQAVVMTLSVIPLWKIGKLHGLPDWQRMLLCVILLLFPAFSGGASYDIHENCFLTPLILWLFYEIDRENLWVTAVSAILTLTVKEDAAVYVAIIALWLTVRSALHWNPRMFGTGALMLAGSLLWFLFVTGFLARKGDGIMTYRYDNFIYDDSVSLLTVVKAVIMNPMKAVYECVDKEKLKFIGLTMGVLLGVPILTRRYERYILLIPYILVNLMSDYQYQHDIYFQYMFGSAACLMYLTAVNLADFRTNWLRIASMITAACLCAGCFGFFNIPKAVRYPVQCVKYSAYYENLRNTLAQIPDDVSVAASTFYTTELSQREILYDVKYCSLNHLLGCDYVVISEPDEVQTGFSKRLLSEGYRLYDQIPDVLTILKK